MNEFSFDADWVLPDCTASEAVAVGDSVGIDGIELPASAVDDDVTSAVADRDVSVPLVAGSAALEPFTAPILAEDPDAAVERFEETVAAATAVDADGVAVSAGAGTSDDVTPVEHRENIVDGLREAGRIAGEADLDVYVEPLNGTDLPGSFLTDAEQAAEIVDEVDCDAVSILFDVYHQHVAAGDAVETFARLERDVGHVHVSDAPDQCEPGTGTLDLQAVLAQIERSNYDGFVGLEFRTSGDGPAELERSLAFAERATSGREA